MSDAVTGAVPVLTGLGVSTVVILVIFIGFCVVVGFTKLKKTSGQAKVVKSLDEVVTRQPFHYLAPNDPRGPADQLHTPELAGK